MTAPDDRPPQAREALARCAAGTLPPNVALTWLAMAGLSAAEARDAIAAEAEHLAAAGTAARTEQLVAAGRLLDAAPNAFDDIAAILAAHEEPRLGRDGIAHWGAVFDLAVARSPEASVALYSLGRADLLAAATDEIVAWLTARDLIGPTDTVLDLGCGIGRLLVALAPRVKRVIGTEISPAMAAVAADRTRDHANVTVLRTSGTDLSQFPDRTFDLVLAADSFPYLFETGLADRHVAEAARTLHPGGALVILNWSYRGDLAKDCAEVADHAARNGFAVISSHASADASGDESPFRLWDGVAFHLLRAG